MISVTMGPQPVPARAKVPYLRFACLILNLSAFSWLHFSRLFPALASDACEKVMFEASHPLGYCDTILPFEC